MNVRPGFLHARRALVCIACLLVAISGVCSAAPAAFQDAVSLDQALMVARASRAEVRAASARVDAARQRPAIVSSLDDPIIAPSIDHKPVDPMMKTDRSITFEQSIPLSRIRSHRRRAAEADVDRYLGEGSKAVLKIQAEVAQAFFMLSEKRKVAEILERQIALASQLVKLAAARHGAARPRRPMCCAWRSKRRACAVALPWLARKRALPRQCSILRWDWTPIGQCLPCRYSGSSTPWSSFPSWRRRLRWR